ncbi:MAG: hypothetical protein ACKO96_28875, partial [Flammeovirgaceae bacterium]
AIKNLRHLPRDKINEMHRTFLTHTPPAFLQASVMASLQPSSDFNVDRAKEKMSTEKSREQVVRGKFWSSARKCR